MKTVYIVEVEIPMREFLISSLELTTDLTVVGASGDGKEGYEQCLEIKPDLVIANVGSGTGIFSKCLLAHGLTVVGVEPNREMREAGEQILGDNNNF